MAALEDAQISELGSQISASQIPGQLTEGTSGSRTDEQGSSLVDDCIREAEKEANPPLFVNVTPSGIEVAYSPSPRRHYKVRDINIADSLRTPLTEWEEVPSVTSVLGVLDKPLAWWGMTVGVQGVIDLYNETYLVQGETGDSKYKLAIPVAPPGESWPVATTENVVALLTQHKLTVNHTLTKAGDRGTSVHDAFEDWAVNGTVPHPEIYPEAERPYVEGLAKFIEDWEVGKPAAVAAELMVGSLQHKFAGRYDLRCTWLGGPVVTRCYPKKADKIEELPGGEVLLDLKTSSGTYPSHHVQLEAYELASVECGYAPTDARYIVHVTKTGQYEVVKSKATSDDFLAVLACYRALEDLKGRK